MAKDIVAYASQDNRETPIQDVTVCLYVYFLNSCSTEVRSREDFLKIFTVRTWVTDIDECREGYHVTGFARTRQGVIHADVQLACRAMVKSAVEDFVSPLLLQAELPFQALRLSDYTRDYLVAFKCSSNCQNVIV
ncbi:hypothetical protein WN944_027373 [Citrus x changshan-huyou]|uniref:Uncharacterized protein n=1 Tax=Citrus x changshan-huyou TaxID=2935761 RepID=A0AAP0Q845_9ROSI